MMEEGERKRGQARASRLSAVLGMAQSLRVLKGGAAKVAGASEAGLKEVVLDVRDDLRNGREPFTKIMEAVGKVAPGGRFTLYATFKPVPLIAILRRQGFEARAEKIAGGDWKVVFNRAAGPAGAGGLQPVESPAGGLRPEQSPAGEASGGEVPGESGVVELDNRGLEPPMPMVRTLEAIHALQPGGRIEGYYDRRPMFLLPKLEQMGFAYEVTDLPEGGVRVVIRRDS